MIPITKFLSFDGLEFTTEAACRAHERKHAHVLLVGLTREHIEAALAGDYPVLAGAIETVGARIARARIAAGDLKRTRSGSSGAAPKQIAHHPDEAPGPGMDDAAFDEYMAEVRATAEEQMDVDEDFAQRGTEARAAAASMGEVK